MLRAQELPVIRARGGDEPLPGPGEFDRRPPDFADVPPATGPVPPHKPDGPGAQARIVPDGGPDSDLWQLFAQRMGLAAGDRPAEPITMPPGWDTLRTIHDLYPGAAFHGSPQPALHLLETHTGYWRDGTGRVYADGVPSVWASVEPTSATFYATAERGTGIRWGTRMRRDSVVFYFADGAEDPRRAGAVYVFPRGELELASPPTPPGWPMHNTLRIPALCSTEPIRPVANVPVTWADFRRSGAGFGTLAWAEQQLAVGVSAPCSEPGPAAPDQLRLPLAQLRARISAVEAGPEAIALSGGLAALQRLEQEFGPELCYIGAADIQWRKQSQSETRGIAETSFVTAIFDSLFADNAVGGYGHEVLDGGRTRYYLSSPAVRDPYRCRYVHVVRRCEFSEAGDPLTDAPRIVAAVRVRLNDFPEPIYTTPAGS